MIYIATTEADGSAIYFDIHATERRQSGLRVSGTVGDGGYEGEVLVETGRDAVVTFADAWLGGLGFREFLDRCDVDMLERALIESVQSLNLPHGRRGASRRRVGAFGNSRLAESGPAWLERA